MKVSELIEHLKTIPQDIPVFYVMFDDGYNIVEITSNDIFVQDLEDETGNPLPSVVIGEEWLE